MNDINIITEPENEVSKTISLYSQSPLLKEMLDKVHKVDFNQLIAEDLEKKLNNSAKVVCVIDELLKLAINNNWGLCRMNGSVYAYNGEYWSLIDTEDFKSFLGDAAHLMGINRVEAKHFTFQNNLFHQFNASARLDIEVKDRNTTLINLKNGTFEISPDGSVLREFRREDALTYQLPFDYREEATYPWFQEYLDRVLPDKEMQDILSEFIGYIFTKDLKLEKCLLLYGSGANGKSVFFEIINALLGKENVSNFSLGNLAEEHNRALIADKLLNYGSEIRGFINTDIFKQLASGEPVQCRKKYGNSFTIRDYARLCFNCNELPSEVEQSEAFFRRFLIIPFEVTIPEEERDPELANDIIFYELSGIFTWVLEGLRRLLHNKAFTHSDVVKQVIVDYKQQSDSIHLFLEEENFNPSSSSYIQLSTIYTLYKSYCQNDGYRPLGKSKFNKRLRKEGYVIERRNSGYIVFISKRNIENKE